MEPNKILSASILDLVFNDRNKEYGAYELRKTYSRRITKALLITAVTALLAFTGAVLANSIKPDDGGVLNIKELTLEDIKPEEKQPEPLPELKKPEPEPQVQTEKLTVFNVVPDEKADDPPPTVTDLQDSKIDLVKKDGVVDEGIAEPKDLDDGKGIIEEKDNTPEGPANFVEIDAKFVGNWEKFLTRNLNGNIPADNGAQAGKYTVIIQFVVDLEGNVSDIKPLTGHGYGMEEEAVRVLKKATKWEPGIQNGYPVKAYRRQPITFIIEE
jgi:protein TonB